MSNSFFENLKPFTKTNNIVMRRICQYLRSDVVDIRSFARSTTSPDRHRRASGWTHWGTTEVHTRWPYEGSGNTRMYLL